MPSSPLSSGFIFQMKGLRGTAGGLVMELTPTVMAAILYFFIMGSTALVIPVQRTRHHWTWQGPHSKGEGREGEKDREKDRERKTVKERDEATHTEKQRKRQREKDSKRKR